MRKRQKIKESTFWHYTEWPQSHRFHLPVNLLSRPPRPDEFLHMEKWSSFFIAFTCFCLLIRPSNLSTKVWDTMHYSFTFTAWWLEEFDMIFCRNFYRSQPNTQYILGPRSERQKPFLNLQCCQFSLLSYLVKFRRTNYNLLPPEIRSSG